MTSACVRRTAVRRAGLGSAAVALLVAGCALPYYGGYYGGTYGGTSSGYSSSASSSTSEPADASATRERSYVVPNKDGSNTILFKKPGETTVVRPDGGVTIIQRDRDGTRTYVDSHGGVKVVPPGSGRRR